MKSFGIRRWVILLAMPVLMAAASDDVTPQPENAATKLLESKVWAVRTYRYEGQLIESTGPRINAFILFKNGKVDWQLACGVPWGVYHAQGDEVVMRIGAILRGLCLDPEQGQWRAIEEALRGTFHVTAIADDGLAISGPDGTVRVTLTSHLSAEGQVFSDTNDLVKQGFNATKKHEDQEGFSSFLQAAEKGNPRAAFLVGSCYESGLGVAKDLMEARRWYQRAAEQGDVYAKWGLDRISK